MIYDVVVLGTSFDRTTFLNQIRQHAGASFSEPNNTYLAPQGVRLYNLKVDEDILRLKFIDERIPHAAKGDGFIQLGALETNPFKTQIEKVKAIPQEELPPKVVTLTADTDLSQLFTRLHQDLKQIADAKDYEEVRKEAEAEAKALIDQLDDFSGGSAEKPPKVENIQKKPSEPPKNKSEKEIARERRVEKYFDEIEGEKKSPPSFLTDFFKPAEQRSPQSWQKEQEPQDDIEIEPSKSPGPKSQK